MAKKRRKTHRRKPTYINSVISISLVLFVLGILMTGASVVNINPQYTSRELDHQLQDSGAVAIIVLRHLLPNLDAVYAVTF